MLKKIWRKIIPNPFECLLKDARKKAKKTFLIAWNRGLGDVALGIYAMMHRILEVVPDAFVTFITREDLKEGFELLPFENMEVLSAKHWQRGVPFSLEETLSFYGKKISDFDYVIEKADPTYWVRWQLGTLVPKLAWSEEWDLLWQKFEPLTNEGQYVGVHVQTETSYCYEKNWPFEHWENLFHTLISQHGLKIVLFGFKKDKEFKGDGFVDLRGETSLYEMLSIIKNRLCYLIVPDSGVLSLSYFLNVPFKLKIVSLWADPRQGILKQNVRSPNPLLKHIPILGKDERVSSIDPSQVLKALFTED